MTGNTHMTGGVIASIVTVHATYEVLERQLAINGLPDNKFITAMNQFTTLISGTNENFLKFISIPTLIIVIFSIFGSLFPDIDHRNSKIGNKAKFTSFVMNKFFGHRGIIHAPLLYLTIYIIVYLVYTKYAPSTYHYLYFAGNTGFFAGALSHLILDTFNKTGIPWFMPFSNNKISIASIKTRSDGETIFEIVQITIIFMYVLFITGILGKILKI